MLQRSVGFLVAKNNSMAAAEHAAKGRPLQTAGQLRVLWQDPTFGFCGVVQNPHKSGRKY
jgi:hypothetical protein